MAIGINLPNGGYQATKIGTTTQDMTKYGTYHMGQDPSTFEPLRTNHFEFEVMGLQRKLDELRYAQPTLSKIYSPAYDTAEEVIRLSVSQASVPHFNIQPISIKRGNSTLYYAASPNGFASESIQVTDYVGLNVKQALYAWQNIAYDVKTEKVGLACNYKLDCFLREYTPDYIKVREWKLLGCWIAALSENAYNSQGGDSFQQITATIQYDKGWLVTD